MENKIVATWDDVPDDIKELVEYGIYTKEEAIGNVNPIVYREPTSNWIWYQEKHPSFYDPFPDDLGGVVGSVDFVAYFQMNLDMMKPTIIHQNT